MSKPSMSPETIAFNAELALIKAVQANLAQAFVMAHEPARRADVMTAFSEAMRTSVSKRILVERQFGGGQSELAAVRKEVIRICELFLLDVKEAVRISSLGPESQPKN